MSEPHHTAAEEAASAAAGGMATKIGIITGATTTAGGAIAYLQSMHLADWALLIGIVGTLFTAGLSWWRGRADAIYKQRHEKREQAMHLMQTQALADEHELRLVQMRALEKQIESNAAGGQGEE